MRPCHSVLEAAAASTAPAASEPEAGAERSPEAPGGAQGDLTGPLMPQAGHGWRERITRRVRSARSGAYAIQLTTDGTTLDYKMINAHVCSRG